MCVEEEVVTCFMGGSEEWRVTEGGVEDVTAGGGRVVGTNPSNRRSGRQLVVCSLAVVTVLLRNVAWNGVWKSGSGLGRRCEEGEKIGWIIYPPYDVRYE